MRGHIPEGLAARSELVTAAIWAQALGLGSPDAAGDGVTCGAGAGAASTPLTPKRLQ